MKKTLYKDNRVWEISVDDTIITIRHGQVGGKIQEISEIIYAGKNIGKKNETTPEQQALLEAESKYNKQLDKGYTVDGSPPKVDTILPMLAHKFSEFSHKIVYPAYVQPKLDGCLSGDTLVETKEFGLIPIKKIVDEKLNCSVRSFNPTKNQKEFKKVLSFFKNKEENEWYEITTSDGRTLKLTGNHMVYLPDLMCYRRVDELTGNENLMLDR